MTDFRKARREWEAGWLREKVAEFGGNMTAMAHAIGFERSALYRKCKQVGITLKEEAEKCRVQSSS